MLSSLSTAEVEGAVIDMNVPIMKGKHSLTFAARIALGDDMYYIATHNPSDSIVNLEACIAQLNSKGAHVLAIESGRVDEISVLLVKFIQLVKTYSKALDRPLVAYTSALMEEVVKKIGYRPERAAFGLTPLDQPNMITKSYNRHSVDGRCSICGSVCLDDDVWSLCDHGDDSGHVDRLCGPCAKLRYDVTNSFNVDICDRGQIRIANKNCLIAKDGVQLAVAQEFALTDVDLVLKDIITFASTIKNPIDPLDISVKMTILFCIENNINVCRLKGNNMNTTRRVCGGVISDNDPEWIQTLTWGFLNGRKCAVTTYCDQFANEFTEIFGHLKGKYVLKMLTL